MANQQQRLKSYRELATRWIDAHVEVYTQSDIDSLAALLRRVAERGRSNGRAGE